MEKYEVLGQVGEGSFGQVYKARKRSDGDIVAFKVIRKRGRSLKELKGLRQECEIQRHLHHPNIIQMLDSFETENEIVVITEYADRELYELVRKAGRLSEERAQVIACDLVSALYYLHSNRVLHRDLKPQNVLLEANGVAKLCDFGFARSMSTGTHVLTSIKGTPLYMAPELIEECPYDHNADLWSLGCIVYELVMGRPPFQTTSILHLVRLIRFEEIKWPENISHNCKSFLQGLLQKDPSQRLTWPALLDHPFVQNRIIISESSVPTSFTTPLSASQAAAKQQQFQNLVMHTTHNQTNFLQNTVQKIQQQETKFHLLHKRNYASHSHFPMMYNFYQQKLTTCHNLRHSIPSKTDSSGSVDVLLGNLSLRGSLQSDLIAADHNICHNNYSNSNLPMHAHTSNYGHYVPAKTNDNIIVKYPKQIEYSEHTAFKPLTKSDNSSENLNLNDLDLESVDQEQEVSKQEIENKTRLSGWIPETVDTPIENEEWVAFLQRSMEEVMGGEIASLIQENCVSVFVSPLRNPAVSSKVMEYVAYILSVPFTQNISKEKEEKLERVYLDVRVVPNLVYGVKLLMRERNETELNSERVKSLGTRTASSLSADELQALEAVMVMLCRLIYHKDKFLTQFCDAIYIVNGIPMLQQMLTLHKRKAKIVSDLIAIFNIILRSQPENAELVEKILFKAEIGFVELFEKFFSHKQAQLRSRSCMLICLLGRFSCRALQQVWNKYLRDLVENLTNDDDQKVKKIAENTLHELKQLAYF